MMKKLALLCLILAMPTHAANVVIINANNASGTDMDTVQRIYLGKVKAFSDGSKALPLTYEQGDSIREVFNNTVLNKSESQYSAFWSKLVFTGRGTPPESVSTQEEMVKLVGTNPNTIGFVDESLVDDSVKVIGSF